MSARDGQDRVLGATAAVATPGEQHVIAERRREGVGRTLLDRFVELAHSKGHQKMWLYTDAGNEAARHLYDGAGGDPTEKLGYWWVFG